VGGGEGGVLIAVSEAHFRLLLSCRTSNTLTVRIQLLADATEWCLTGVYGPQLELEKVAFMNEIRAIRQNVQGEWLISEHFNLIYKAVDKNNLRINMRLMG
jgi:hypothetical protein